MQGMAAFTLDLLAQLPEAYQAFSPLIDTVSYTHLRAHETR